MEFPRASKTGSNFIGGIKDKLGFPERNRQASDDVIYDDSYQEYDSYDDAYSNEYYDEGYEQYAPREGDYERDRYGLRTAPLVTSEEARVSAYQGMNSRANANSAAATTVLPAYGGSFDDIDGVDIDAAHVSSRSPRMGTSTEHETITGREYLSEYDDFVSPYQKQREQASAQTAARSNQVAETASWQSQTAPSNGGGQLSAAHWESNSQLAAESWTTPLPDATSQNAQTATSNGGSLVSDTMRAAGRSIGATREITVIKPQAYADAEQLAHAVKAGNIAVLDLRHTDGGLSKRLLDFSFGVAAALDAHAKCLADKVFMINAGADLTLEENHRLRKMGVL